MAETRNKDGTVAMAARPDRQHDKERRTPPPALSIGQPGRGLRPGHQASGQTTGPGPLGGPTLGPAQQPAGAEGAVRPERAAVKPEGGGRILVVDDEPHIVELVRYNLVHEGYEVVAAYDGHDAIEKARTAAPDLVILDLMLPYIDGLEVCRHLRRESSVPILMLTAKDTEQDRVLGLELGADDYVTKPFSPRELVARVRAILRRTARDAGRPAEAAVSVGGLVLDPVTHEVRLRERLVELTTKEFDLLRLLMSHPNQVFTRDFLLEHIWGYEYFGSTRTVDMHISRLREKIEDDPITPTYIVTVRGVGYKFKKDAG